MALTPQQAQKILDIMDTLSSFSENDSLQQSTPVRGHLPNTPLDIVKAPEMQQSQAQGWVAYISSRISGKAVRPQHFVAQLRQEGIRLEDLAASGALYFSCIEPASAPEPKAELEEEGFCVRERYCGAMKNSHERIYLYAIEGVREDVPDAWEYLIATDMTASLAVDREALQELAAKAPARDGGALPRR